jgi:hypothetical protein
MAPSDPNDPKSPPPPLPPEGPPKKGRGPGRQFQPGRSGNPATQFQPGQTGNPGGRPKGLAEARARMQEFREPLLMRLIHTALAGGGHHVAAARAVLEYMDGKPHQQIAISGDAGEPPVAIAINNRALAMIEALLTGSEDRPDEPPGDQTDSKGEQP